MARTPDPTDSEFLEALPLVDGGIFEALEEIRLRLKANVPGKTAALNTALGLSGVEAIPVPKHYGLAPDRLTDEHIDTIQIGVATSTMQLSPGVFRNDSDLVIYSVGRRIEGPQQFTDCHRRAAVIRGILRAFQTGCIDSADRVLWSSLNPTGVSLLPEPYSEYSGAACYYKMVQFPGQNAWSGLT